MALRPSPHGSRSAAGGAPIAIAVIVGTLIGVGFHQPTIGFLIGLAVGVAIAVWVWLRDRA